MIRLRELDDCFEGVIPSIIATAAADGTPNISYLSHVAMVDDDHIAISNQFFAKTAANIRANPHVSLQLVNGRTGKQYRLDATWVASEDHGPFFAHVENQLHASSAQAGMAGVMRLRAIDIFRVDSIAAVPSPFSTEDTPVGTTAPDLETAGRVARDIAEQGDTEGVISALLAGCGELGFDHAVLLLGDPARGLLATVASRGYDRSGVGSEIGFGDGLIGTVALTGRSVKVSDMSRIRRLGAAIGAAAASDENRTRTIALPALPDAMSQMAVPLRAQGTLQGVLFTESRARLAFGKTHELVLEILAAQGALALALCEALASQARPARLRPVNGPVGGRVIQVVHHSFDDSVFVDNIYVIKGVAGRLLAYMLDLYVSEGRSEFTNREIRAAASLRLPEIKDNLETRLLLLRRRMDERNLPIRLFHAGRGQVRLLVNGTPDLQCNIK